MQGCLDAKRFVLRRFPKTGTLCIRGGAWYNVQCSVFNDVGLCLACPQFAVGTQSLAGLH